MDDKKRQMIELLCNSALGCTIACNIIDALEDDLVELDLVREYLQECFSSYLSETNCKTSASIAALFHWVGYCKDVDGHARFLFRCCTHTSMDKPKAPFSTVMPYRIFAGHLVDRSAWNKRFGYRAPRDADCGHPAVRMLCAHPNSFDGVYPLRRAESLGGYSQLFWITRSSRIQYITKSISSDERGTRGTRVRDYLGLIHREQNVPLVELRLKASKIFKKARARPTFVEAGDHRRFKIRPDLPKNIKILDWGFTADLLRLEQDKPSLDGAPEQVVEPIKTEELGEISCFLIGCVETTRGEEDDDKFTERLMNSRTKDELVKRLLSWL